LISPPISDVKVSSDNDLSPNIPIDPLTPRLKVSAPPKTFLANTEPLIAVPIT